MENISIIILRNEGDSNIDDGDSFPIHLIENEIKNPSMSRKELVGKLSKSKAAITRVIKNRDETKFIISSNAGRLEIIGQKRLNQFSWTLKAFDYQYLVNLRCFPRTV